MKTLPIQGYEGLYSIREDGIVLSHPTKEAYNKREMELKQNLHKNRKQFTYMYVKLSKNDKKKMFFIHRLVALHFIPNPHAYPIINHKDGNKLNNSISNLEWCTLSHNIQHAYDTGLRRVSQFNIDRMREIGLARKGKTLLNRWKITKEQIVQACDMYESGGYTFTSLANMFGVSKPCMRVRIRKLQQSRNQ